MVGVVMCQDVLECEDVGLCGGRRDISVWECRGVGHSVTF